MPVDSVLELERAHRAMLEAKTPDEQRQAAKRYVDAERKHLRRVGVPVEPQSAVVQFLPFVLLACLVVTLIFGITNANKASNLAQALVTYQLGACERGNDSQVATVGNLRSDVRRLRGDVGGLRADLDLLRAFPQTPALEAAEASKREQIVVTTRAIEDKLEAVTRTVEARAPVAIRTGSVKADCAKVVPSS